MSTTLQNIFDVTQSTNIVDHSVYVQDIVERNENKIYTNFQTNINLKTILVSAIISSFQVFYNGYLHILIQNSLKFVSKGQIENKPYRGQAIIWLTKT